MFRYNVYAEKDGVPEKYKGSTSDFDVLQKMISNLEKYGYIVRYEIVPA